MRKLALCALGFALWSMPLAANAAPACFASPLPKLATVATGNPDPACQVLAKVLESAGGADIAWLPGQIVNSVLKLTEGGFAMNVRAPIPYQRRLQHGVHGRNRRTLALYRRPTAAARTGSWWVPKEFVTDSSGRWLPTDTIADLLALPPQSDLRQVAYSGAVDSGTVAYVGIVAPAFGHRGGAIQFWFPREPIYTKDVAPPIGVAK